MDVSAHGRKNNFVVESAWAAWQRLALQKLKSSVIRAETGGRQRCKRSVVQAETGLQERKSSVVEAETGLKKRNKHLVGRPTDMGGTIPIGDGHVGIPNGQRQLLEVRHRREGISGKGKEWSAGCAGDKRSLKSQRTVAWPQETIESSVRCTRYTCGHEGEVHAVQHGDNSQDG